MNPPVGVPVLLSFDGMRRVYGRGEAGWTVVSVPAERLLRFLDLLPRESWMPGTHLLAAEAGAKAKGGAL